jgi:hypothetical protein
MEKLLLRDMRLRANVAGAVETSVRTRTDCRKAPTPADNELRLWGCFDDRESPHAADAHCWQRRAALQLALDLQE